MAIKTFKQSYLEDFFYTGLTEKLPQKLVKRLALILDLLDSIADIQDLRGVKDFHKLKGVRKNYYSLHISGNWCLTFIWQDNDVYEVMLEDYH